MTTSHGNTLDSKNYEKMMGQTINKITYYTDNGIYEIDADQYVPVKFNGTIAAENADVESGKVNVTVEGLPDDYQMCIRDREIYVYGRKKVPDRIFLFCQGR